MQVPPSGHAYKTGHRTRGRSSSCSRHSLQLYQAFLYSLSRVSCPEEALTQFSSFGTGHRKLDVMDLYLSNLMIVLTLAILGVAVVSVVLCSCFFACRKTIHRRRRLQRAAGRRNRHEVARVGLQLYSLAIITTL